MGFYWAAARYDERGGIVAYWTSERPGRTGPRMPWWQWLLAAALWRNWKVRLRRR